MPFDNLLDIRRLIRGTCSFSLNDIALIADIQRIEYHPLGAGAIDFDLIDIRTVEGKRHKASEAHHTISCFFAEVTDRPREMIIEQMVNDPPFGRIWSFRCRD